jgi:hypothetical protein
MTARRDVISQPAQPGVLRLARFPAPHFTDPFYRAGSDLRLLGARASEVYAHEQVSREAWSARR